MDEVIDEYGRPVSPLDDDYAYYQEIACTPLDDDWALYEEGELSPLDDDWCKYDD